MIPLFILEWVVDLSCIRCGYCCVKVQCLLSSKLYGRKTLCPALKWDGERHFCEHADLHAEELDIGFGCCSPFNPWRREPLQDRRAEYEGHCR
jgi:hypothetical protein